MKLKISYADIVLVCLLLLFVSDSILNFFGSVPLFVSGLIIIVPLMLLLLRQSRNHLLYLSLILLSFLTSFTINFLFFGFNEKDIADLLFIIFTVLSYFYLNQYSLNQKYITLFFYTSLALLSFSFLGIDVAEGSTLDSNSDDLEYIREYNQGLFRISHVASYFFTFLLLFFTYLYSKTRTFKYLFFALVCLACVFYIGSRTTLVCIALLVFTYHFKFKYIFQFGLITILGLVIFLNINWILTLLKGTIFFQYFSIIATFSENFSRLSRVIIWTSWWEEICNFTYLNFLFGKSFHNSLAANMKNIHAPIWFHNDFLSIGYAYGIFPLLLYISFFVFIFFQNRNAIKSNRYIYIFFFSMPLTAVFNGFYYYYTFFLFYIFIFVVQYEKNQNIRINENSNLRN